MRKKRRYDCDMSSISFNCFDCFAKKIHYFALSLSKNDEPINIDIKRENR